MLTPFIRDTFTITVDELTGDWSGWTFKGDLRQAKSSTATLVSSFTVDTTNLVSLGEVTFTIAAATMQAATPATAVEWYCDLRAVRTVDNFQTTLFADSVRPQLNVTP